MRNWDAIVVVGVVALGIAGAANASQPADTSPQPHEELDLESPARWTLSFEPSIWAPGLAGDLRLPGGTGTASINTLGVDEPEITPLGELHFRKDRLVLSFSGFGFSLNETATPSSAVSVGGVAIPSGGSAPVDIDLFSAQGTVGWRVINHVIAPETAPQSVTLSVDVYGGVRGYDLDARVGGAGASDGWVEPIIGAKFTADILEDFTLDVALDAGWMPLGDRSSSSFDIIVGFQWRPIDNVGLQFGWRQIILDLRDGDGPDELHFDGSLAGVYGSVVFRF